MNSMSDPKPPIRCPATSGVRILRIAAAAASFLLSTSLPAGAQSSPAVQALEPRLREIFALWDVDSNGVVSGREYDRPGGGPSHYDLDRDGVLTAEEYGRYHNPSVIPRTPPRERAGAGSPPPAQTPGRYFCTGYGLNAGGIAGFVPKGAFILLGSGRYTANNTTGRFTVTGGKIRFAGGAYAGITGEYSPQEGTPRFVLAWPGVRGSRTSTQYCRLVRN